MRLQQHHRRGGSSGRSVGGRSLLALFLLLGAASAFLTPAATQATQTSSANRRDASVIRAAADGENGNGNGLPGGLDLAKIFTPPSTKAPFGGLGQQISSFFERLLNPEGANNAGEASQQGKGKSPKPKRRTGGPVSVVFGATGRAGREIVTALLAAGHDVVAAVRNETKLADVFGAQMLEAPAPSQPGQGLLDFVAGVDVTDPATLGPELFQDADHVVLALGPVGGPQPGGGFGFYPGLTSEDVDYKGVVKVVEAFRAQSPKLQQQEAAGADSDDKTLFSFRDPEGADAARFERLDDVIMGGRSSSVLEMVKDEPGVGTCVEYKGNLVVEDGGFCGHRASGLNMDLTGYDGLRLRIKGDGNRYKLNLKTTDAVYQAPECVYQVAFDTLPGQWATIDLPFDRFLPVIRNRVNYKAPGLGGIKRNRVATSFGIVYSRFEFNRAANPYYQPGAFSLKIQEISAYKAPRPAVVLVSSAGAERNAKVETEAERRAEIPIVQLNPGGILNWKYKAETHLRSTGLPYTVLRACGLVPEKAMNGTTRRLQAGQGDVITGTLTRQDLAAAVVGALDSPFSAYKTLEVRRDEAGDAVGKPTDFDALYKPLVRDIDRAVSGLLMPFPEAVDPPGDVTPERRQEILNDPRVQATVQRDRQLSNAPPTSSVPAGASAAVAGAGAPASE